MEARQLRLFRLEEMETRLARMIRDLEKENKREQMGNVVKITIPRIKHLL